MGNAESSSEPSSRNNNNETDEGESSSTNKFSSALKVGAAVAGGAALLALGALSLLSQSQKLETHGMGRRNREIKIMSYNVWSREDVEVEERMEAIGDLVQEHSPDIVVFQEVTPLIYELFQSSSWWPLYDYSSVSPEDAEKGKYFCMLLSKLKVRGFISMYFNNSSKEKGLFGAEIEIGLNKTLIVATSHLKSPNPPKMNSEKRVSQAKGILRILKKPTNVIFGGDMNWDEDIDGAFPLERVWKDAWEELRGGDDGWTFDTKSNTMLQDNPSLQKRLDRFICKLEDYSLKNVEMIGTKPIPGISYYNNKGKQLPVFPSDHYGLILTISVNV